MLFVDLDGVLFDWMKSACKIHGRDPKTVKKWDFYEDWGMTEDEFWAPINAAGLDFWANLEDTEFADELIDIVKRHDKDFFILTKPSLQPECAAGKLISMQRKLGKDFRRYIFAPNKWPCSQPGRVLIDDSDDNIDLWKKPPKSVCGGGLGILVAQPWNRYRDLEERRISCILEDLENYHP